MDPVILVCGCVVALCVVMIPVCIAATQKRQKNLGLYFIGGPNSGHSAFLSKHPEAKKVFQAVESHGGRKWTQKDAQALFALGAKAVVIGTQPRDGLLVFTPDMMLAWGTPRDKDSSIGTQGQIFAPNKEKVMGCLENFGMHSETMEFMIYFRFADHTRANIFWLQEIYTAPEIDVSHRTDMDSKIADILERIW